jgi:hypothetical protein
MINLNIQTDAEILESINAMIDLVLENPDQPESRALLVEISDDIAEILILARQTHNTSSSHPTIAD